MIPVSNILSYEFGHYKREGSFMIFRCNGKILRLPNLGLNYGHECEIEYYPELNCFEGKIKVIGWNDYL